MRHRFAALLSAAVLGTALSLTVAGAAEAKTITPGAFCKNSERGSHQQSADGDWYVCDKRAADASPNTGRWYADPAYTPAPATTATPTPTASGLPITGPGGGSNPWAVGGAGLVIVTAGAGVVYASRRRVAA